MELVTIQVNISAVVELTYQFLPQMQLRWSGSIINISAIVTSHSRYKKNRFTPIRLEDEPPHSTLRGSPAVSLRKNRLEEDRRDRLISAFMSPTARSAIKLQNYGFVLNRSLKKCQLTKVLLFEIVCQII